MIDKVYFLGDWVVNKVIVRFILVFKDIVCLVINYYFGIKKFIYLIF